MTYFSIQREAIKPKKNWHLFWLAAPLMTLVILFQYVPLMGWVLSLFEYKPGMPLFKCQYIGLKYFGLIFSGKDMGRALLNTLVFSTIRLFLLVCPMIFAILINEIINKKFRKYIQVRMNKLKIASKSIIWR